MVDRSYNQVQSFPYLPTATVHPRRRLTCERAPLLDRSLGTTISNHRRIFGGMDDEPELMEMCESMLNVVVGLFGGVDYDDAVL